MNETFEKIFVDGQSVIIPTFDEWRKILDTSSFEGMLVFSDRTRNSVEKLIYFVGDHPEEFRLGLYLGGVLKRWLVLPLYILNDKLQRVQIEHVRCDCCSWEGRIANPTEPTLYMGLPAELDAIRKSHALPKLSCPLCRSKLPRPAIWIENKLESINDK